MDVVWSALAYPGMEHLRLETTHSGVIADGVIIGRDEEPIRIHYRIECDTRWRVRSVHLDSFDGRDTLRLTSDGEGQWQDGTGRDLPQLTGCIDIDISATPFTNTLPIRRLGGDGGTAHDIQVVYFQIPAIAFYSSPQRYTLLNQHDDSALWRFEWVNEGFVADITVDADGLVVNYPELFQRL